MTRFETLAEDWEILEPDDRYRLLIDLGRDLETMPGALKTDATRVRGCSASVWVYPENARAERLHFLADSDAAITKGIVALILTLVQDRAADEVVDMDIAEQLAPFELSKHLSSNRTQGIPNMIALIRETAARLASGARGAAA
ncbi:MAG: SufE family protein [Pacificimonas sp.]|jgi:cysteine desulfuration protein SufE|nr:SufE family protein [Pacificimonas sp.]